MTNATKQDIARILLAGTKLFEGKELRVIEGKDNNHVILQVKEAGEFVNKFSIDLRDDTSTGKGK